MVAKRNCFRQNSAIEYCKCFRVQRALFNGKSCQTIYFYVVHSPACLWVVVVCCPWRKEKILKSCTGYPHCVSFASMAAGQLINQPLIKFATGISSSWISKNLLQLKQTINLVSQLLPHARLCQVLKSCYIFFGIQAANMRHGANVFYNVVVYQCVQCLFRKGKTVSRSCLYLKSKIRLS